MFLDAIIGEIAGSPSGFSSAIKAALNQNDAQVNITIAFRDNKLTVLPLSSIGGARIARMPSRLSAIEAKYVNGVKLIEQQALIEFEQIINDPNLTEAAIHRFLELNPELLGSGGRRFVASHPVLTFGDDRRRIPDFILEREDGFCDLLEIKRPQDAVVVGSEHRRMLSTAVHRAVSQLREYAAYFASEEVRNRFRENSGLKVFQPNLIVVIGRASQAPEEMMRLQSDLPRSVTIQTYDDLLNVAKSRTVFVERHSLERIPRHRVRGS